MLFSNFTYLHVMSMEETIKKAIQLHQQLEDLRPLSKEDELRVMQKFRLDWNYHSNHLEGNSLSHGTSD